MNHSLGKILCRSSLALAMGLFFPLHHAQGAIFWPDGGVGGNDKEADFQLGYEDGQADCRAIPLECGVQLGDMIKDLGYGETEPNDHIINADGLLPGRFYHANSFDQFDEDWYYITTDRRNQKLTVYFLGDSGNYTDMSGWVIQIRDLNGNVIAAFDSTIDGGGGDITDDTNPDVADVTQTVPDNGADGLSPVVQAKITEVTLGAIGSYYISVKSKDTAGMLRGYHIGATLRNTGQVTGLPDENRFDSETEPNDSRQDADVLRSNVAMVGVFDRTLVKRVEVTTPGSSEVQYFYKGCSEDNPATVPLGATSCECDLTSITEESYIEPQNPNVPPSDGTQFAADACEARTVFIPEETKWVGIFDYDQDVYVYHSEGDEQLRVQICTRTACEFTKVHLEIVKDGSSVVLMDGPIEPGQVIDMGVALSGDYYFIFSAEEEGVNSETGDSEFADLVGPYDILLMSTRMSPTGGTVPASQQPPAQPSPAISGNVGDTTDGDATKKEAGNSDSGTLPFPWFDLFGG